MIFGSPPAAFTRALPPKFIYYIIVQGWARGPPSFHLSAPQGVLLHAAAAAAVRILRRRRSIRADKRAKFRERPAPYRRQHLAIGSSLSCVCARVNAKALARPNIGKLYNHERNCWIVKSDHRGHPVADPNLNVIYFLMRQTQPCLDIEEI